MSIIEKIVEIPVIYYVPLMDCQHAARVSTFRDADVGEERDCLVCQQMERKECYACNRDYLPTEMRQMEVREAKAAGVIDVKTMPFCERCFNIHEGRTAPWY